MCLACLYNLQSHLSSPHSAGRRQGGVDEHCSAAVDKNGTVLGSHRSLVLVGDAHVAC